MSRKDLGARLEQVDWATVGVQLVGYAAYLARGYRWGSNAADTLALGMAAEDVAALAIRKVWSGERRWDPERHDELLRFLKGVVRSEMGHLYHRSAARHEVRNPTGPDGNESEAKLERRAGEAIERSDPESALIDREERAREAARIHDLRAAVADRPELIAIIDAIGAGCGERPRHLAEHLGIAVPEINNRLKRLRRAALRIEPGVPQ